MAYCIEALSFLFCPLWSFQGLQPILGFNYGAGRYDRARDVARLAIIAASCIALCLYGRDVLPGKSCQAFHYIFFSSRSKCFFAYCDHGLLSCGIPNYRFVHVSGPRKEQGFLILSLTRQVIFFLPCVVILPRFFLLKGIWLAFPTADALAFLVTVTLVSDN